MMFCQIVLDRDLVDNVIKDPFHLGWTKKVEDFQKANPLDPLPFPYTDPDPQVRACKSYVNPHLRGTMRIVSDIDLG